MDSCERMFEVPTLHKLVEQPDVKASASVPSTVIGVVVILIPVAVVAVAVVVHVYYRRRKNRSQSDPENVQVLKEREYVHESVFLFRVAKYCDVQYCLCVLLSVSVCVSDRLSAHIQSNYVHKLSQMDHDILSNAPQMFDKSQLVRPKLPCQPISLG